MTLPRRSFLRGSLGALGTASIALPLLPSLREAHAGAAPGPKRLAILYTPDGFHQSRADPQREDLWTPTQTGSAFELGPLLEPLAAHRDDLLVVSGLEQTAGPELAHDAVNCLLTGTPVVLAGLLGKVGGGPSIDQAIAQQLPADTRFASLELGAFTRVSQYPRLSFRAAAEAVPTDDDPRSVFDRVFAEFAPGEGADGLTPGQLLRARRLSVLDAVRAELASVRARAGAEDRVRLDAHVDKIREIETTLANTQDLECSIPEAPADHDPERIELTPTVLRLQTELLAMSLVCDLTRVGTLVLGGGQSGLVYSWLGQTQPHHEVTHDLRGDGEHDSSRWHASLLADLLDLLAAAPEGDGRVLDNTVVMWCTDVAGGFTHSQRDHAVVLAGSCGGAFTTGRHVRYSDGARYNDLLLTLMHAMGIDAATFGDPNHCTGPLRELS
jgi:hypothetical protein